MAEQLRKLYVVLGFSALGGFFKIFGGVVYGSRALFVDALTSIANFIAAYATIYYYKVSKRPPDIDHHYGHYKLGFGGTLVSLITYSFVAGLVISELYNVNEFFREFQRDDFFPTKNFKNVAETSWNTKMIY